MVNAADLTQKLFRIFFQLFQQELVSNKLDRSQLQQYVQPLRQFMNHRLTRQVLMGSLQRGGRSIDTKALVRIWQESKFKGLPPQFNWAGLSALYLRKVQNLLQKERYRQRLLQRYNTLPINYLAGSGQQYRLPLRRLFVETDVRQSQSLAGVEGADENDPLESVAAISPDPNWASDRSGGQSQPQLHNPARPVLDVLQEEEHCQTVILGLPGSGKSMLLQFLLLQWVEAMAGPLPLWVDLQAYGVHLAQKQDGQPAGSELPDLLAFVLQEKQLMQGFPPVFLQQHLRAGQVLLLLDGLDGIVTLETQQAAIAAILQVSSQYPNIKIVVTSRIAGYNVEPLQAAGFRHLSLQVWESAQIEAFIQKWYALTLDNVPDRERLQRRLQDAINRSAAVAELACIPWFLTMFAMLNVGQELPRNRTALYEQMARVLLLNWTVDCQRLQGPTPLLRQAEYQLILQQIARQLHAAEIKGDDCSIRRHELMQLLVRVFRERDSEQPQEQAGTFLQLLHNRNAIFSALNNDLYGFIHTGFRDYFCARSFVQSFEAEPLQSIEQLKTEVFGPHWQDLSWQNLSIAIAGTIASKWVGEMVDFLIAQSGEAHQFQNLFLATDCLMEVTDRRAVQSAAERLRQQLELLLQVHPEDPESDSTALDDRNADDGPDPTRQPLRDRIVHAIADCWATDLSTLPWLKRCAQTQPQLGTTIAAAIATHYKENPDTFPWLADYLKSHKDEQVRQKMLSVIRQYYPHEPKTLALLKDCFQSDGETAVRWAAVTALLTDRKQDPEILDWLKTCAQEHPNERIRLDACQAIAAYYQDDATSLDWLKSCTQEPHAKGVGAAAVSAIATHYQHDISLPDWLETCVLQHADSSVRWAAMHALVVNHPDRPETLSLLKTCAQEDEDEGLRRNAIAAIAECYKDAPETLEWLQALLQSGAEDDQLATANSDRDTEIPDEYQETDVAADPVDNLVDDETNVADVTAGSIDSLVDDETDVAASLVTLAEAEDEKEEEAAGEAEEEEDIQGTVAFDLNALKQPSWLDSQVETVEEEIQQPTNLDLESLQNPQYLSQSVAEYTAEDEAELSEWLAAVEGASSSDTLAQLRSRIQTHENPLLRSRVMAVVADQHRNDPDTLIWLQNRAQNDESDRVRMEAFNAIAQRYRDCPGILPWLQSCALSSPEADTRRAAVTAIAQHFADDPNSLTLLKLRAQFDEAGIVRGSAITAIGYHFSEAPDTFSLIQSVAQADVEEAVRAAAIATLANHYSQKPETFSMLKSRLQLDEAGLVRSTAISALAEGWSDDPEMLGILYTCILNDPFQRQEEHQANPRQIALAAMLKYYPGEPLTLELVQDRAENDPDRQLQAFAWANL